MDAFAISICAGLTLDRASVKNSAIVGLYFGGFQAMMPVLGYIAGARFADKIRAFDHWIAFALLAFIGLKMVRDSFAADGLDEGVKSPTVRRLAPLAVATSVDALAVGVSFAFLDVNILVAASFIGIVTFTLSFIGVRVGKVVGLKFKDKATFAGGAILVIMGAKILFEHMNWWPFLSGGIGK